MSILQIAATVFSIFYIILATRNDVRCFYLGIISSVLWGIEDFVNLNLKFDGFLQIFYLVMSFVGIWQWQKGKKNQELEITRFGLRNNLLLILTGLGLTVLFVPLMQEFTTSNSIYLDAGTSVFSVLATFLLVRRIVDTWIYLIVCDLVYIYIYGVQGAWLFAGMMVIYSIMAAYGYYNWKRVLLEVHR